jgi:hypothetical protein
MGIRAQLSRPGKPATTASRRTASVVASGVFAIVTFAAAPAFAQTDPGTNVASKAANTAIINVGEGDCSRNSAGTIGFYNSCKNHEYWCADFAKWVWVQAGVPSSTVSSINAAAYSFYSWGKSHGGVSSTPGLGDAVIFSTNKGDHTTGSGGIHHVAIVTAVSGSSVKIVSGDWGGHGSTQQQFADSAHVVKNNSGNWIVGTVNTKPASIGQWIVGYALP